jgi:peptidoglycan/xylan/chitin deacetylase (PgdA/CDA1 family)
MDDGWEGVYTYAYPVLKEYGFPFTIYLYKKYVNIGGRS